MTVVYQSSRRGKGTFRQGPRSGGSNAKLPHHKLMAHSMTGRQRASARIQPLRSPLRMRPITAHRDHSIARRIPALQASAPSQGPAAASKTWVNPHEPRGDDRWEDFQPSYASLLRTPPRMHPLCPSRCSRPNAPPVMVGAHATWWRQIAPGRRRPASACPASTAPPVGTSTSILATMSTMRCVGAAATRGRGNCAP